MFKIFKNLLLAFVIVAISVNAYCETKKDKKVEHLSKKEIYQMMELFGEVFEMTRNNYVEETDEQKMLEEAMNGMLSSLDPHSHFLNKDEYREITEDTSGEFGGLGIQVTIDPDTKAVKVITPVDDTPAAKAGIETGDLITHIDDEQVQGIGLNEAVKRMKGKPGTKVKLTIFREGKEPFTLTLKRAIIKAEAVKTELKRDDTVGYIRIATFSEKTSSDLERGVKKLDKDSKGKIRGYVLDLRNNPGGLLPQAIKVSDAFLEQGEIVSTRSRDPKNSSSAFATDGDLTQGKPVVVLINGGSASASEIVAGALQDHKRAVVVGTKSFGKGSVQTLFSIGNQTAIKITTARYYTPSGTSIQGTGIQPDIEVKQAKIEEIDPKDLFSENTLAKSLDKKEVKKDDKKKDDDKVKDYQLERAMDILQGLIVYSEPKQFLKKEKEEVVKQEKENEKKIEMQKKK
ncbi:MAG: S41 family peptidase [Rickettsiales bacterium]|jgi:carboxyl-terminal processing protease|nr:S41 family peptidase [Rickettsiales bacterium]